MLGLALSPTEQPLRVTSVAVPPPVVAIAAIDAPGWSAQWAGGTPPTFAPGTSPQTIAVSRAGFDAAGATTSHAAARTFTKRVRQSFPNQASLTAATVALDDYVYSTDTIAGVTNNSAEASPKPIAMWAMPPRFICGNSLGGSAVPIELVCAHRNARAGREVACVIFKIGDGTSTISVTVAATTISGRAGDKHPVIVYALPTTDVSALTSGLITVDAEVYPWIGGAASVAKSATDGAANGRRGFSTRFGLKDPTLYAAPVYAYLSTSGSAGGVVSTDPAIAAATPFATLAQAYTGINTARGASGFDGVVIRVGSGSFVLDAGSTTRNLRASYLTIQRDPAVVRASAIVTFGAAQFLARLTTAAGAPSTSGCIRFNDVTVQRTGAQAISSTGEVIWDDCDFVTTGQSTTYLTSSNDYWFNSNVTGNGGSTFAPGTGAEHRIFRGMSLTMGNNTLELFGLIGCDISISGSSISQGSSGRSHSGGVAAFNRLNVVPGSAGGAIGIVLGSTDVSGFALLQNVFEWATANPGHAFAVTNDAQVNNVSHVVAHNNTFAGYHIYGRENLFYDDGGTERVSKLLSMRGNIHVSIAHKGDVFRGINQSNPEGFTSGSPSTRIGNWPYLYGVGCQGEFAQYDDADDTGIGGADSQAYPGLGANFGTSVTVRNDPLFTDYKATANSGTTAVAGAGGGTYSVASGSPAKGMVAHGVLSHDFAGSARAATGDTAGAYA